MKNAFLSLQFQVFFDKGPNSANDSRKNVPDRPTFAVPMTDNLSYYDAKLKEIAIGDGFLLTLAIPLARVFKVYHANLITIPQKDSIDALQRVTEGEYLAISESQIETTVLTKAQYDNCIGLARYHICHKAMETQLRSSLCPATLRFHHAITALKVCDKPRKSTEPWIRSWATHISFK